MGTFGLHADMGLEGLAIAAAEEHGCVTIMVSLVVFFGSDLVRSMLGGLQLANAQASCCGRMVEAIPMQSGWVEVRRSPDAVAP